MKLTVNNVWNVLEQCMFKDDEPTDNAVLVEGITIKLGFHPERLNASKPQILELLHELPESFQKGSPHGDSFLNAYVTKDGTHWGEHKQMEALFILGKAINAVEFPFPRGLWGVLPGGMPVVRITE